MPAKDRSATFTQILLLMKGSIEKNGLIIYLNNSELIRRDNNMKRFRVIKKSNGWYYLQKQNLLWWSTVYEQVCINGLTSFEDLEFRSVDEARKYAIQRYGETEDQCEVVESFDI